MLKLESPQSRTINNISFRVYKSNMIDGGLAMVATIEDLYRDSIVDFPTYGVSLIPKDTTNMYFALKFDTLTKRDQYRDYVFEIGEGRQFGHIKFPDILADYSIGGAHYLLIQVTPFLYCYPEDIPALRERDTVSTYCGLPIDLEEIHRTGLPVHDAVSKILPSSKNIVQ